MSGGKSSSSSKSQQQSQSYLDPAIVGTLMNNYGQTQNFANNTTYSPLTSAQIQTYQNPYQKNVIDTTTAALQDQTNQQIAQNDLSASASGAFNGDRAGVQDAVTQSLANKTLASTVANLTNQNYSQALSAAQTENTAQNQYPIMLRQLINQSLGLVGNPVLSQSTGSSSGSSNSFNFGFNNGSGGSVPAGG